jgi:alanine racemase
MEIHRPTQALIDLSAIEHNLGMVRAAVGPEVKILAVVKADAYGHGMIEVARVVRASGAEWLGVGSVWEGKRLRDASIGGPILVLGPTAPRESPLLIRYGLSQVISSPELAEALSAEARRKKTEAGVHLKIDSGMGRLGVRPEESLDFCQFLSRLPGLRLEGLMTHFATADFQDKGYARHQLGRFQEIADLLQAKGFQFPLRHAANSAAIIDLPESHLDLVRPGIMLYGCYPSPAVSHSLPLRPALTFRTEVGDLKSLRPGESVSYGRSFVASRSTQIAVLPVGYADGYDRGLSNRSHVILRGQQAPVIGTICMDMTAVDVTDILDVGKGDEVVLFGRQGDVEISAEDIASLLGTIPYEVLCSIGGRVERVYLPARG